jgi:hypothetical protein
MGREIQVFINFGLDKQANLRLTCIQDAMLFWTAQATLSSKDFFSKQKIA